MRIDITPGVGKIRCRLPPRAWVRIVIRNVRRHTPSHKVPYPDTSTPPLQCHDTTPSTVVVLSEGGVIALHSAARLVICLPVTILVRGRTCLLALVIHFTVRSSMQRHLIARVGEIDSLHDIDFAVGRPIVDVGEPKSWPSPAAMGCVIDVEDEETTIIGVFGGHADAVPAGRGSISATRSTPLLALLALLAALIGAALTAAAV